MEDTGAGFTGFGCNENTTCIYMPYVTPSMATDTRSSSVQGLLGQQILITRKQVGITPPGTHGDFFVVKNDVFSLQTFLSTIDELLQCPPCKLKVSLVPA